MTNSRPDLDAAACLKRVQEFMRAEIMNREKTWNFGGSWRPFTHGSIIAMGRLADSVDELVADILRPAEYPSTKYSVDAGDRVKVWLDGIEIHGAIACETGASGWVESFIDEDGGWKLSPTGECLAVEKRHGRVEAKRMEPADIDTTPEIGKMAAGRSGVVIVAMPRPQDPPG